MKFENLYNLKSFDQFKDSAKAPGFKDSATGVLLARQLEYIDPTIFEVKYPSLAFMNCGMVIDNSGGVAEIIKSKRKRGQGSFAVAGDESDSRGLISITAEQSYINVKDAAAHSKWTDIDAQRAKQDNTNLPSDLISRANEIYNHEVDEAGMIGIFGNTGLLNNTTYTSSAATGDLETLLLTSAISVYDEVASWIRAQWDGVNNIPEYMANTMILPVSSMNLLSGAILNSAAGTMSILSALKLNFPGVNVISSQRAESVSATKRAVLFSTDRNAGIFRLPMPLTVSEIVKVSGFDYRVDYKYRVAGLDILQAESGLIKTGL